MWQESLSDWEEEQGRQGRRALGAVWTPADLSAWMADWLGEPYEVLDPAAGCGNLLAPLAGNSKLIGCEIDPGLTEVLSERFDKIELHQSFFDFDRQVEAITMNPPYLRSFADKDKIHALLGIDLPLSTNLAILFCVRAYQILKPGGRAAFLIPTEFMQTRAGKPFKEWLLDQGAFVHIIDLEHPDLFGEDVATTACLVLLEKPKRGRKQGIYFSTHSGRAPFPSFDEQLKKARLVKKPDASRRWRPGKRGRPEGVAFSDLAEIYPGHITGNNSFFLRSFKELENLGLKGDYTIIRPHQLPTPYIHNSSQIKKIKESDQRRFLVRISDKPNKAERDFIALGEEEGVDQAPTFQDRDPWFYQAPGRPCRFWIGNFRRDRYLVMRWGGVRPFTGPVVPNLVNCDKELGLLLFAYLASTAGQERLRSEERHAGKGLYTLRSGALKEVLIPDLTALSGSCAQRLREAGEELTDAALRQADLTAPLARLDRIAAELS